MSEDQENFDDLKKLLALKRHEQPPPGYFNSLPQSIWKRIETEKTRPGFWQRIFPGVSLRPAVAYAFGLIVCGTLIVGIGSALKEPAATMAPAVLTKEEAPLGPIAPALAQDNSGGLQNGESSTNPVMNPTPYKINVQPVNFNQP